MCVCSTDISVSRVGGGVFLNIWYSMSTWHTLNLSTEICLHTSAHWAKIGGHVDIFILRSKINIFSTSYLEIMKSDHINRYQCF